MSVYICLCLTFVYLFYVYITKQIQNLSDKKNKSHIPLRGSDPSHRGIKNSLKDIKRGKERREEPSRERR